VIAIDKKNKTQRIDGIRTLATIVLVGATLLGSGNALALSYTFGNLLTNGDFEGGVAGITIPGWSTSGGIDAVNVRMDTDLINIKTGNVGFSTATIGTDGSGFFGSQFAVLGDASRGINSTTPGEWRSGVFKLYQDFVLAPNYNNEVVISYTLNFDFLSVFDGRDSLGFAGSDDVNDVFFATLINLGNASKITLAETSSNGLTQTCIGNATLCPDSATLHQINTSKNTSLSGLLPGKYRLELKLREIANGLGIGVNSGSATRTNTAVGIDNIVVNGSVDTQNGNTGALPEPGALILMAIGLLGFQIRKPL
jgi:MprA protease rhombosortase-interaction domain-containing protein